MKTRAELEQAHGTPAEFKKAVAAAIAQGLSTPEEGRDAIEKYLRDYANASAEARLTVADILKQEGERIEIKSGAFTLVYDIDTLMGCWIISERVEAGINVKKDMA